MELFSASHWSVLLLVAALNLLVYTFRIKIRKSILVAVIPVIISALLILSALSLQAWDLAHGIWTVQGSLPLHLCGISLPLCALLLLNKNYALYEIVYFWGVGGAAQALLTPDTGYAFPHFIFFQFFISHGLIVTACLWVTFVDGFRPSWQSVGKAFGATNLYMLVMAVFNYFTGSNYLYICQKPKNPSLLSFLGPWPWYILSLEVVCLLVYFVCCLPFIRFNFIIGRHKNP